VERAARFCCAFALTTAALASFANPFPGGGDFLRIADERIRSAHGISLFEACPVAEDLGAETVLREYGAIFVANRGVLIPLRCVFPDESEVSAFHSRLKAVTQNIGGVTITLQEPAMTALVAARSEARAKGLDITPRGGARAASRNFADTKRLWDSRFLPGLEYWAAKGRITREEAEKVRKASIPEQVTTVLEWEKEGIYFARGFSKSILFSVAAPGASQHISMLALDVSQFGDGSVREILAKHGWFQTVRSDLPHFTFLGAEEKDLPGLGLEKVRMSGRDFWVPRIAEMDKN